MSNPDVLEIVSERADFEAALAAYQLRHGFEEASFQRNASGQYLLGPVEAAWMVWCLARGVML